MVVYAVVRVRGSINVKPDIKKTLSMLRLNRVNHAIVIEKDKSFIGMLERSKDYITWGEIDRDTLANLIKSKGRLEGNKPLTDGYIKSSTSYSSIDEFADALIENKIKYRELPNIKPIFRLNPPKGGYEGIKRAFKTGGALGYRGNLINDLIRRMI